MIPQEKKLLSLLSSNEVTFFIPPYQRNYEWSEEQCKVFIDDIMKTYDRNMSGKQAEHFFGSVTYFQSEAVFGQPVKLVLIDGQQRVTTTMLFLVALRNIIEDKALKDFVDSRYLKNGNVSGESEYKIKLKQVESDWAAYKNIVLEQPLSASEKDSAVYRNYSYFTNKLQDMKDEGKDLRGLIEKGLDKFSVITIELQPDKNEWENPQEIFESMNSLGKPLSLADLVRNYLLLGQSPEKQTELYNKYWLLMEKKLPQKLSDYIRDYMQGDAVRSYPKATEANYKELYSLFKERFRTTAAEDLLKDLEGQAGVYSWIVSGVSCGNKIIDNLLQELRTINVTTANSFLMVLLKNWTDGKLTAQNIVDILQAFKIYCLRRRIIGATAGENKNFPLLVGKVKDLITATDKKEKMFDILSRQESNLRLPNDIEVSRFMETMNFYNFRYCKFVLSLVEEALTKSMPDQADTLLQIEHIMPKKLNDKWEAALGPEAESIHQEYVNVIGNLTLIRHNQELGNKEFEKKLDIYENNAGLQIAKTEITNQDHWGKDTIKKRTKWIIKYILQDVLPIPVSKRKTNNYKAKDKKELSFQDLQLIGLDIAFVDDKSIVAHVTGDKEVEFEGKKWKLSPLTKEIQTRRGVANPSGSYHGAAYWEYDGVRLYDIIWG